MQLLVVSGIHAQNNFRFEHLTSENGLSENFVYTVFQDKKGFIWIGTHDGLNRYDGYNFIVYRHIPGDSNSLHNNTIYAINEDDDGNIWIGTNGGLCVLNPKTNKFTRIALPDKNARISQIIRPQQGELLIEYTNHLFLINTSTFKLFRVRFENPTDSDSFANLSKLSVNKIGDIHVSNNMNGYFISWKYDTVAKHFRKFIKVPVAIGLRTKIARCFWINNNDGTMWAALEDSEFIQLDTGKLKQGSIFSPAFTKAVINHVYEDNRSNLWISTVDGLLLQDQASGERIVFRQTENAGSISSEKVLSVLQDRSGIIWIATANGLNKLNPEILKFGHLTKHKTEYPALHDNFILGIRKGLNNSIHVFYNNPISVFTKISVDKKMTHIPIRSYNYKIWVKENCILNADRLNDSILESIQGSIGKIRAMDVEKPLGKIFIGDHLWFIGWDGVFQVNSEKFWELNSSIGDVTYYKDELWVATESNGLFCFDTKLKKITAHYNGNTTADSLNVKDLTSLLIETNGDIWIGTKGGGLNYFNRGKRNFIHYSEKDGLCNNSIYSLVKDNNGNIWIGTSNGLSCFDPKTKKFRNYFRPDGLINSEFNRFSAYKLPDGSIMMGGMNGIDLFHPDSIKYIRPTPVVQVTSFKVFDESIYSDIPPRFRHDENVVTIQYAAMDFTNPAGNKFSYKLEAIDKNWIDAGNRNFTTYSNLPPGSYHFFVKAANSDGVWGEIPAQYSFTILPAFYQTWWFKISVFLLVSSLIYLLFRYRLQQKLHVFQIRNRIHRDLHDDVGATLSSVKAYSELLKDNPNNPVVTELIQQNATEMIEKLEVIAWATNPQHDSFGSLLDKMKKFGYPLCHTKKIELDFSNDGISSSMNMSGEARQNILLIFKEAINNTVKYSDARHCNVEMGIKNSEFNLRISDDGAGMSETILGNGSGMKNMKARAAELGGEMKTESGKNNGTTINIRLPYPFRNTKFMG